MINKFSELYDDVLSRVGHLDVDIKSVYFVKGEDGLTYKVEIDPIGNLYFYKENRDINEDEFIFGEELLTKSYLFFIKNLLNDVTTTQAIVMMENTLKVFILNLIDRKEPDVMTAVRLVTLNEYFRRLDKSLFVVRFRQSIDDTLLKMSVVFVRHFLEMLSFDYGLSVMTDEEKTRVC